MCCRNSLVNFNCCGNICEYPNQDVNKRFVPYARVQGDVTLSKMGEQCYITTRNKV